MRAVLFDTQFNPLERFDSNVISPPVDFWDIVDFSFAETPDARFVVLAIYGKDARFWQGNYGAKVANCSVKVACPRHNNNDQTTAAEEETQLPFIGDAFDNISVDSIGPIDAIARFYGVVRQSQQQHTVGRVQNRGVHRSNVQPPSLEDLRRNRLTYFRLPAVIENQNNDDDDDDDDDMDDFIDDEYDGSGSGGEQIDESGDVGQNSGDGQRRPSRGRNDADHESQGQSLLRWLGFL